MAKMKKFIILIMLALVSAPFWASAQTADNLILSLSPEIPGPEENVTAAVKTFAFDLERSTISWSLNGKKQIEGIALKSFSFKTGKAGTKTALSVNVTTPNNVKIVKSLTIEPAEADLLIQAVNSYAPPFYRGRSLPARESNILAVVIPSGTIGGKILKAEDFIYTWTKNGALAGNDASGFGKNSFAFKNRLIDNTENVGVEMSGLKNGLRISRSAGISLQNPEIVFYEKDSVKGVNYNQALSGEFILAKDETAIVAAPYFFSVSGQGGSLTSLGGLKYKWFFNDEVIPGQTRNELVVKKPETIGQTRISVEIEKPKTLFQNASVSLILNY